ncbi:Membrane protein involved in the export of O-antigen and teichoic acid [Tenacibaculum sp. MAR_2009_124]|uniref:lipopolysaccharide biosynthesis protein n=1 Tax=Tenacibaculum sp. MAR_2009_124 TaxID=1250059 RepID=UPI00089C8783|nr:lipopolysaccharide biosynthesis protein [Tenacibaculum sp. MAR_2009_124]SEC89967.1 Membrane protein involved in the export of O-antigen and teichoic acid [Tenacibaculum sp. MAR_2009_124]
MGIIFKQSLRNTLIIYLGFLIGGINTVVLYARFLKEEYYGLVTLVLSTSNLVMPLMALGIHFTIVKFFSSYDKKEQKDRFLSSIIFFPLIIAIIIGYFWNYFHILIMKFLSEDNVVVENYTLYIYIVAISCAYFEVFYSWAKVQMQSVFGNFLKELYNRIAVMILLCAVYFEIITKQEFVIYLSYAYVIRTIIMSTYALKLYAPKFYFGVPDNFKEVIRYSLYIILAGSASAIILDIDKLMIGGKDTLSVAAYYAVAVFIGSFIEAPSRAMTQILDPLTSKSINEDNNEEVVSLYKKSSINLMLVGGLFFVLVNTNVTELFKIMPEGYAGGELVVFFISCAKLFNMSLGNNRAIINNSKYYRITLFNGLGMALMLVYLNKYFYYDLNYGTEGLAFATFLSIIFFGLFKTWFVHHKLKMFPFTLKTILQLTIIVGFYFVFNYWNFNVPELNVYRFNISPIINIILKSVIIIILYMTVVIKLKVSDQINDVIKRFIK